MKRPTLQYNVCIAIFMTIVTLLTGLVLRTIFTASLVPILTVGLLTMIYICHLLSKSKIRVGRISLGVFSLTVIVILIFLQIKLSTLLLISVGLIWMTRSLLHYSSFLPAIADLSLCIISFASAIWGFFISDSIAAAIWCFFLTQALSSLIPRRFNRHAKSETKSGQDRFTQAYQSAEMAIRQLAQK